MFVVHATKKLRDRVREEPDSAATRSTTALGAWYATVLFWKPQLALFVNETTLLPVFVPLAPAATVIDRFPERLGATLRAHSIDPVFITAELIAMTQHCLAKTANRSVVGIMNEFTHMASQSASRKESCGNHNAEWSESDGFHTRPTRCSKAYRGSWS